MLSHQETMQLIEKAQQGDDDALATLVQENTPLIKSVIKRYVGKNVEYDDLFQISSIGLIKAVKNFSVQYNVRFSTYAVPMMFVKRNRNTSIGGKFVNEHPREAPYYKKSRYLQGNFAIGEARKP